MQVDGNIYLYINKSQPFTADCYQDRLSRSPAENSVG